MSSRTKKTECIRRNKKQKNGATRKAKERNKGTTPKFSIHPQD